MKINKIIALSASILILSCREKNNEPLRNEEKNFAYQINWKSCKKSIKNNTNNKDEEIIGECGKINVPLDWGNQHGEKIELALVRFKAKNPQEKIGSLFFNPGGPGGSAVDFVFDIVNSFSELNDKFDFIGLDPRGIGGSKPIKCSDDLSLIPSFFPKNETEFLNLKLGTQRYYESCVKLSGSIVDYVDTESGIKDLEAVRVALGGEKLNFLGFSYGTSIAATYAQRYPQNSRALVLDGVADFSKDLTRLIITEAKAKKGVFKKFVKWCEDEAECGNLNENNISNIFHGLHANYQYSIDNVEHVITKEEIIYQFFYSLTHRTQWSVQASLLKELQQLNKTTTLNFKFDAYHNLKKINGPFSSVWCLDYPTKNMTWESYSELKNTSKKEFPLLNGITNQLLGIGLCTGWASPRTAPLMKKHTIIMKQPALLVTSLFDAITPPEWAKYKAEQIPGSKIIYFTGNAHGSYFHSKCVQQKVNEFLITAQLPLNNITCNE